MPKFADGLTTARIALASALLAAPAALLPAAAREGARPQPATRQQPAPQEPSRPQEPTKQADTTQTPQPQTPAAPQDPARPAATPEGDAGQKNTAGAEGEKVAASAPPAADAPLFKEYKGVTIGMTADEARRKLGRPEEKGDVQDFFVFSNTERARVYYDGEGKVSALIVTYLGKNAAPPKPPAVLGEEIESKDDGSLYKMVRYPDAGYYVAYSRTGGDEPLTIITMQKMHGR